HSATEYHSQSNHNVTNNRLVDQSRHSKVGDSITQAKVTNNHNAYTTTENHTVQPIEANTVEVTLSSPPKVGDTVNSIEHSATEYHSQSNHNVTNNRLVDQSRHFKVGDSITQAKVTNNHNAYTTTENHTVQPIEANTVEVRVQEPPKRAPGQHLTKNYVQTDESQRISETLNQVSNSQDNRKSNFSFSPVFHIQGSVDDGQINKLEQMVLRLAKKIEKMSTDHHTARFAD
ncbi:hypothetical protein J0J26_18245, partial [Vibrio vulnificus]|nr:hypothetical protein [Vibrio vulnificus]MBN8118870.1 hypothetical protein [Vibrio vulnificus]